MDLVNRKNRIAFEAFYDRHSRAAYSLAYRIVGEAGRAEDVTQEAFLGIWRSSSGYDPIRGSVRSWLLQILRNRAIDELRRTASPVSILDSDDQAALDEEPSPERTDTEVFGRERAAELDNAVRELPPEQYEVIRLAYFGGFSQAEIAELLEAPLGTIKGRVRLGLEHLRSRVDRAPGLEEVLR